MTGVIAHPRQALDDLGDARQRPQVRVETVRPRALAQRFVYLPQLGRVQLRQVDKALRQGARAHGFDTDLWTLPRVAKIVERLTGVRYHPGHVWKVLGAMDWSLQRPAKRGRQYKKTLGAAKPGSSSRTKVASRDGPRPTHLGAERRDAHLDSRVQLEEDVHLRRPRLPLGWTAEQTVFPNSRRELQHR